jgi:uncharacterized membrane protein
MSDRVGLLKTTITGGLVFLVPVVILLAILGKALEVTSRVAVPLAGWLPFGFAADILFVNLLASLLILVVCFLAGLLARTEFARRAVRSLETRFLDRIPVYSFIKSMTASMAGTEGEAPLTPVYVRLDDYAQIAFEIERLADGAVVVYLPGAPNPWSGAVCIMTPDRVSALDATMLKAVDNISHLGRGSDALLPRPAPGGAA